MRDGDAVSAGQRFDVLSRASTVADPTGEPIEISVAKIGVVVITEVRSDHIIGTYTGRVITQRQLKNGTVFCVFDPSPGMFDGTRK